VNAASSHSNGATVSPASSSSALSTATATSSDSSIILSLPQCIEKARLAIKNMIESNVSKPALSPTNANISHNSELQRCCSTMAMYISNLLEQANISRYRKISTSNATFKTNVAAIKNHTQVFESVGFVLRGHTYEWSWYVEKGQVVANETQIPSESDQKEIINECLAIFNLIKTKGPMYALDEINLSFGAKQKTSAPNTPMSRMPSMSSPTSILGTPTIPKFDDVSLLSPLHCPM
jgi:hypothetical protein